MGLLSSDGRGLLVAGLLLVATASSALAAEDFVITASFGATETFALGEFAALVEKCQGSGFADFSTELKAQCVHGLISTSAVCSTVDGKFMCTVNGVQIDTSLVTFTCDDVNGCPSSTTDAALLAALGGISCDAPTNNPDGFTGICYQSAYCLQKAAEAGDTTYEQFGEFCPSATGEYCCGDAVVRDTGYFPGGESVGASNLPDGTVDFLRRVDHVVDMSFKVEYTVEAPAQLKIEVEVPYVTSGSTVTYTEDGAEKVYNMCPSTYMIDFEPPIESYPQSSENPNRVAASWLPLHHFPHSDLVGRPRSSCGNYNMTYADEADFKAGFKYANDGSNTLAYGAVPAVDATVWDPSVSTQGIPNAADTFWKLGTNVGGRVNYTSGSDVNGFFDLVKTHYMCKDYHTNNKLVTKVAEPEPSYINGVAYPVETYEWTLSVCQVGFFGLGCADAQRQQMYAKTCAKVPASFSVSPQQVSHVAVSPVSDTIVSKTFLQSVKSTESNCAVGSERIVLTLNLVLISPDYAISDDAGHDIITPSGILEDVGGASGSDDEEEDLVITEKNFASTDAFLAATPDVASGVYRLNVMDLNSVATNVRYRKIVVVTKCYDTGYDSVEGTRATPAVFSEDVADGADNVLIDVEVIVKKNVGAQSDDVKNTLNLRVLATKESLVLQSEDKLKQKDVTAYQKLYGSYEIAKMDTAVDLPNALPAQAEMSGGDQICSKHQIQEYDAQVSNLIPNAVGACMLTAAGVAAVDGEGTPVMGRTIKYKAGNMVEPADYTFGCFQDWIDVSDVTPDGDGVYVIPNQLTRVSDTHDSMFWFVQKEQLSTVSLPGIGETLDSRFGTGLFYYNSSTPSGEYVVVKSDQMQLDKSTKQLTLTDPGQNAPGCVITNGNMRSACNLVCFDLVDGLLTDPLGSSARQVLVHHVSVATVATEDQSIGAKKFGAKHRRMLLESASVTQRSGGSGAPGDSTTDTATTGISVVPGPKSQNVTVDLSASASVTRDFDGPSGARVAAFVVGPIAAVIVVGLTVWKLGERQKKRSEALSPYGYNGKNAPVGLGRKLLDDNADNY